MTDSHRIHPALPAHVATAADCLRAGGLVAFPTETVYGLGACARNGTAVARIFAAKGRPRFNPLIVHYGTDRQAFQDAVPNGAAEKLAARFWPGPLTLVLPRRRESRLSELVSAGLPNVAVRVPNHPVASLLLAETGEPIAAPSANRSGTVSPTRADHVYRSLRADVDMILDGGATSVGLESTIVDLTTDRPAILRPGGIPLEALADCLGTEPQKAEDKDTEAPRSPGRLARHYAPRHPLRLNTKTVEATEALIVFGSTSPTGGAATINLSPSGNLVEAAANLFAALQEADELDVSGIAVMPIPETGLGVAINDRLVRAARS